MSPTIGEFFSAWELFGPPALAATVAGLLLGVLGVYIVIRRMVFLAAALSQAAGLGVALAFYVEARITAIASSITPSIGGALFTGIAALPFFAGSSRTPARRDGWMGLVWILGAAGALAVGSRIDAEDIHSVLFGSAVVVLPGELSLLVVLAAVVLAMHVWWRRAFVQVSLDPDGARVRKLPVPLVDAVLLATLALSISSCTRVLGALPVFAFSVLPALASLRVSRTLPRALVLAGVVGALSGFLGYLAAFLWSLPVGAAEALVALAFALAGEAIARIRRAP
jgi:zinc transport system permease protein